MGYGARALQALNSFYSGEYFNLDEVPVDEPSYPNVAKVDPVSFFVNPITLRSLMPRSKVSNSPRGQPCHQSANGDASLASTLDGTETRTA